MIDKILPSIMSLEEHVFHPVGQVPCDGWAKYVQFDDFREQIRFCLYSLMFGSSGSDFSLKSLEGL